MSLRSPRNFFPLNIKDEIALAEVLRLQDATEENPVCTLRLQDRLAAQVICVFLSMDEEIEGRFTAKWSFAPA